MITSRLRDDLETGFESGLEEAVVDPARWPERLDGASRLRQQGACSSDRTGRGSTISTRPPRRMPRSATAARAGAARILACAGGRSCARGVAVDQDFATAEEFARLPFDEDLLARGRPAGFRGARLRGEGRASVPVAAAPAGRSAGRGRRDGPARRIDPGLRRHQAPRRPRLRGAGAAPSAAGSGAGSGAHRPTPAAARLAQALSGGTFLAEAASRLAVTAANARWQRKAIVAKTGTDAPLDLVGLVTGIAR